MRRLTLALATVAFTMPVWALLLAITLLPGCSLLPAKPSQLDRSEERCYAFGGRPSWSHAGGADKFECAS